MPTLKLEMLAAKIHDKNLRKKVLDLLENPAFEINGKTYEALSLKKAPAGLSHHHSYQGGYFEHVTSAANIALAMCDSVDRVYHGKVNRDLVIAGILLHDIFKAATYSRSENGSFSSTPLAEYLDHLSLVTAELVRRDFPLELVHIVAAHHGQYGPVRPRTLEALICHLADFTDSRLNGEVLNAAQYLIRRTTGQELSELNSEEAFEIVHSKSTGGWKSVTETVDKIKRRRKTHKT